MYLSLSLIITISIKLSKFKGPVFLYELGVGVFRKSYRIYHLFHVMVNHDRVTSGVVKLP